MMAIIKYILIMVLAFLPLTVCSLMAIEGYENYNEENPEIRIEQNVPDDAQELFSIANDLYINGEFEKAADTYEKIILSGYHLPELYYNLGNAYYRSNKIPHAILNYERAILLAPADEDIKFNLELARMQTRDRIEELPGFFISNWWKSGRDILSAGQWAIASVAAFISFLVFFSAFLISFSVIVKKFSFWSATFLFFLSVLSFSFGLDRVNYMKNHDTAIVFAPVVPVKSSPDINSADLFIIHEGTRVTVEDSISEWRAVRLSDGNKGWVRKDAIEMI